MPATTAQTMIALQVEIPEELFNALQAHLENHPSWSQNRAFTAAIALFLMQGKAGNRDVNRLYLDTLFDYEA